MAVKRAKSIGRLYDDVSEYDLVVVPNSPLADALNRRLERPQFGPFAITPRRLATRRRETAEDRNAFLSVIAETDLNWKQVSYAVGNLLQCWEYEGTPDAILEYDAFDSPSTRAVLDAIEPLPTSSRLLTEFRIQPDATESVAVVGERQLTNLERSTLPDEYDAVDRFTDESFELPPFRLYESPAAIVDVVLDSVTTEHADDVGIVLDAGSEYSPLVESALETAGIPYYGGPGFMDDQDHRAFVQFLRCTTAGSDTRVALVRPLLSCLDVTVPVEHDEKRLSEVAASELEWLQSYVGRTTELSFGAALTAYETKAGRALDSFRAELEALSLLEEPVSQTAVDRLTFYLERYEVPVDRADEGVLLADARSASFVDRPVVFYLGLDDSWTHDSPSRPWVDRDEEFDRNLDAFQSLLQSGVRQYYLVQDTAGGSPVTPCLYFEELLESGYERFSDMKSVSYSRSVRSVGDGFEHDPPSETLEARTVATISQSSLNSYANSPRDYFFGALVETSDKDYFREGNLFHDFAEFAVNHPEFVETYPLEDLVDLVVEETRPFHRPVDVPTRRTTYRVGLETILEYLDENAPDETTFLTPSSGWGTNFFAEHFDRDVDSPVTERWFEDEDLGLEGKIDLVRSPTRLVDFKSGRKNSASEVTKHASLTEPSDRPNFQALLYLTYWRRQQPDEPLEFTFFHFLETLDDVVTGNASIDDCLTTLTYRPTTFESFLQTRDVFNALRSEAANDCNKTFSKVSYDSYRAVCEASDVPRTRDADEMATSPFGETLRERMIDEVGDYVYVDRGCKQAIRHLCGYRKRGYFERDLDEFEQFVDERIAELNEYLAGTGRFPVDGRAGEPNYRYVDNRDMLLTGDRPANDDTAPSGPSNAGGRDLGVSQ